MDHLRRIAKAHYYAASKETQALAQEFFQAMDRDGSGEVDYEEFEDFMREEGYHYYIDKGLFKRLDKNRSRSLDFWEVMTLYYIIKSGRPFCNVCGEFLTGVYFTCVECFGRSKGPYTLCLRCYEDSDIDLNHRRCRRPPRFLDNYSMVEAHRLAAIDQRRSSRSSQRGQSSNAMVLPSPSHSYGWTSSYSTTMVSSPQGQSSNTMVHYPSHSYAGLPLSNDNGSVSMVYSPSHSYGWTSSYPTAMVPSPQTGQSSNAMVLHSPSHYYGGPTSSYSTAMVPSRSGSDSGYQKYSHLRTVCKALEVALSIANLCVGLAACTIM